MSNIEKSTDAETKKSDKKQLINNFLYIILAINSVLTMTMDLATTNVNSTNGIVKFLAEFRESIHGFNIIWLFLFFIFFCIYKFFFSKRNFVWRKRIVITALFFASWMLLGKSYSETASWDLVFANGIQLIKAAILFSGYSGIFYVSIALIFDYMNSGHMENYRPLSKTWLKRISGEDSIIFPWLLILISWAPWLIVSYPAIIPWDTMNQIYQAVGIIEMSNHHPILITYLLKIFLMIGKMIGSDNAGIFIFTTLQTFIFALALSLSLVLMRKSSIPDRVRLVIVIFYCLLPYYPCNAVTLGKDSTYSISLFIFALVIFYLIKNRKETYFHPAWIIMLFLSAVLCIFARKNGIYVILPSLAGLLFLFKQHRKKIIGSIFLLILIYSGFLNVYLPRMNISQGKVQDLFSIPFQQTARYLKTYPFEVTDQEMESIDRILQYEKIAESYNPEISDPVKSLYRQDATLNDFAAYFRAWFTMLLRHPSVYIQATLNNTYGYFYPDEPGKTEDYVFWGIKSSLTTDLVDLHNPERFNDARSILFQLIYTFRVFPGISMLSSIGFHVWLLILSFVYLLSIHQYQYIVSLIPSFLSLVVCILSPINTYSRYAWPIVFLTPFVLAVCILARKEDKIRDGQK